MQASVSSVFNPKKRRVILPARLLFFVLHNTLRKSLKNDKTRHMSPSTKGPRKPKPTPVG